MIIKYTNFSNGVHEFRLSETVKRLGLDEMFLGDADLDVKMDKSSHQIVLDCDLTVKIKFECDRCDNKTEQELKNHFQISYIFASEKIESDDFNLKILSPEEDKIDLREDVFEYAELSVPLKKLCNEDCKGLCSSCGKDLNTGPCSCEKMKDTDIWKPLQNLKEKFNN
jgi:uncharacterized protein